nr:hypothetical protein [Brucella anthropi]
MRSLMVPLHVSVAIADLTFETVKVVSTISCVLQHEFLAPK